MACLNRDTVEAFASVYFKAIDKYIVTKDGMSAIAKASKPSSSLDDVKWSIPSSIAIKVLNDFQYAYASARTDVNTRRFQRACDLISYYCLPHDKAFDINWFVSGLGFCCEYLHEISTDEVDDPDSANYGRTDELGKYISSNGIKIQKVNWNKFGELLNDIKNEAVPEEKELYKALVDEFESFQKDEKEDYYDGFNLALKNSLGQSLHTWLTGSSFLHPFYIRPQIIYDEFPNGVDPDFPVIILPPDDEEDDDEEEKIIPVKVSGRQYDFKYKGSDLKIWNDMWECHLDLEDAFGSILKKVGITNTGKYEIESRSYYGKRNLCYNYKPEKEAYALTTETIMSNSKHRTRKMPDMSAFYLNFANGMTEEQALEMIQVWHGMQDVVTDCDYQLDAYKNNKSTKAVDDIFNNIFGYEKPNVKDDKEIGKDTKSVVYKKEEVLQMCQPLSNVTRFFKRNARVQFRVMSRYEELNDGAFASSMLRKKENLPVCETGFKPIHERSVSQLFQIQSKLPYKVLDKKQKEPDTTDVVTERLVLAVSSRLLSAELQKQKGLPMPFIHAHRIDSAMVILHELYHTWFDLIDINYALNLPIMIKFSKSETFPMMISFMDYRAVGEKDWLEHMGAQDALLKESKSSSKDNLEKLNWKKLNVDTFIILMFKLYAQTDKNNGLLFGKGSKVIKRDYYAIRYVLNQLFKKKYQDERQIKFLERDGAYWLDSIKKDAEKLTQNSTYKNTVNDIYGL